MRGILITGRATGGLRRGCRGPAACRVAARAASSQGQSQKADLVLARDFIHDSLYNRMVGYFEKNVNILKPQPGKDIEFGKLRDQEDYHATVRRMYTREISEHSRNGTGGETKAETKAEAETETEMEGSDLFQLWHTPSTVFRPYYGRALGQCILQRWDKTSPIVIYEVGPGNGSLCEDIMQFLEEKVPTAMSTLEYNLVEISQFQAKNILSGIKQKYPDNIVIHNMSFLDWSKVEKRDSFVVAMEVFDNLPHDVVRISKDGELVQIEQGMVHSADVLHGGDSSGSGYSSRNQIIKKHEYQELFVPLSDPIIAELVRCMDMTGHKWYTQKGRNSVWDFALNSWPLSAFQATPDKEFVPTDAFRFMKTLIQYFPNHYFIMSDFDYLPPTVDGYNGPVVQTRYKGKTVGSSTYLLQMGLCDIFFSTDFRLLADLYKQLCTTHRSEIDSSDTQVLKHREFCLQYAEHEAMKTASGYNPILDDFSNVSFLIGENRRIPLHDLE
jgi:hypothetical protein